MNVLSQVCVARLGVYTVVCMGVALHSVSVVSRPVFRFILPCACFSVRIVCVCVCVVCLFVCWASVFVEFFSAYMRLFPCAWSCMFVAGTLGPLAQVGR